ncbi:MAG TPA: hypothetical protein VJQ25_05810 [Nitrospira sp.]|nr:hypothetical protein [Nitrospira sp.]
MSDVQIEKAEPEGTPEQAEERVWGDFVFEVVTDPEAEAQKVKEINDEIDRLASLEE